MWLGWNNPLRDWSRIRDFECVALGLCAVQETTMMEVQGVTMLVSQLHSRYGELADFLV